MKYRRRVIEVEAVQWTWHEGSATRKRGCNLDEVHAICPDAFTIDSGWTLAIPIPIERRIQGMRDYLVAHVGYYVVRFTSGLVVSMTPSQFEETYEVVP